MNTFSKLSLSVAASATAFALPVLVHAQENYLDAVGTGADLGQGDLPTLVGSFIKLFISLLGVIFLCYTVYAGYLYVSSMGDSEKVSKAKEMLVNGAIGIAIILASYAIATFVISTLTSTITG